MAPSADASAPSTEASAAEAAALAASAEAIDAQIFKRSSTNRRHIPEAIFIENVEAICGGAKATEAKQKEVLSRLQELYSKYQYMQSSLIAQKSSLKTKLPDITTCLDTVKHLVDKRKNAEENEETEYTYQLCENIYARASVPPGNNVCLWLGANCMLEYTLDEATELLTTNEANAKTTLKSVEEDIAFLRDQLTTTEVNIARTHNFGVKIRANTNTDAAASSSAPAAASAPSAAGQAASFSPAPRSGSGEGYTWKQENDEVEISVALPAGAKKADVKVNSQADSLRVEHLGKVLLEGELAGKCRPSNTTWTLTNGRVEITLEKADSKGWSSLFEAEAV